MTTDSTLAPHRGAGILRVSRSRGMVSGLLLILLGVWGAIIPFVGPYFDYAYTPDSSWTWTAGRGLLEVLPGAAAALGGLLLIVTANRAVAVFGGWLASAAGAWFVVGPVLGALWGGSSGATGSPVGDNTSRVVEQIGFFYGLGAAILLVAAHVSGRLSVRALSDVRAAERYRAERSAPAVVADPANERVREAHVRPAPVREGTVRDDPAGEAVGESAEPRAADPVTGSAGAETTTSSPGRRSWIRRR